jgi:protoporphyrinogen oxidase
LTGDEKQRLKDVQYQGIVCASLLLRKPLAGFYVTNITDPAIPFTAVIEMSALVDTKYFGGNALVYLPKYVDPEDPFLSLEDEKVRELFVAGLERMYPGFDRTDIVEFRVSRVSKVFPLPIINYSEKLPTTNTSVRGLHIVNSTQIVNGTLNVNETVQLANRIVSAMFDTQERAAGVSN